MKKIVLTQDNGNSKYIATGEMNHCKKLEDETVLTNWGNVAIVAQR